MASKSAIGKTVVLLILIVILVLLGLLWFDYLGVIETKNTFAPVYKFLGKDPQTSVSLSDDLSVRADLDEDRLSKRLEALDLRSEELDKRSEDVAQKEAQNLQIAQELEDRRLSQEEREKTFNNTVKKYEIRDGNITSNAEKLTGMPPKNAVEILLKMDDQDVIDVLRKVDEIALANGTSSMVAYWESLMPPERVAEIQRKMTNKPASIE